MPFTVTMQCASKQTSDFSAYFLERGKLTAIAQGGMIAMVVDLSLTRKIVDCHESADGSRDRLQTHSFVALFLLVNVFMGVVGTYRTRRRNSET